MAVQTIAYRVLREFWSRHPQAETPLRAWHALVSRVEWSRPAQIRESFNSADFIGDNLVIFDIGGNKFRLVVRIACGYRRVLIKFIGTHGEHDRIDPETVG